MSTDPEPDDRIIFHDAQGSVFVRYACGPVGRHFLELYRRVPWILDPEPVLFDG